MPMEDNHQSPSPSTTSTSTSSLIPTKLDLDNIQALKVLGKGAMGTVFLVQDRASATTFALKVVEKNLLKAKHRESADRRARWEISVLSSLNQHHPFLPTILGTFETPDLIGWAIPYCSGGDLNSLRYLQNDRVFSPCAVKFYLAEIVCALEHLHSMGIAYRDLKPENVLVQSSGHVTLTDFDLSRNLFLSHRKKTPGGSDDYHNAVTNRHVVSKTSSHHHSNSHGNAKNMMRPPVVARRKNLTRIFAYGAGLETGLRKAKSARVNPVSRRRASFAGGNRSNSFVGTEEYVSPEVVKGEGHAFAVDWWAMGVLAYEMVYGKTPFRGKNRKETFRNILMKKPGFVGKRTALIDLIERLLEKEQDKRLGYYRGAEEIKEHEFFNGLRWDLLTEVVRPPFVPSNEEEVEGWTEKLTPFDVREFFVKQRVPSSIPPSPSHSLSSSGDDTASVSLTEF